MLHPCSATLLMVPGWIPEGDHAYSRPISTLVYFSSPVSRDMPGALRTARLRTCTPGEEAARRLGLGYRVRSSAELPPRTIRNLIFLEDYFNAPPIPEAAQARVTGLVEAHPGISLAAVHKRWCALHSTEELFCQVGPRLLHQALGEGKSSVGHATGRRQRWQIALANTLATTDWWPA